MIQCCNEASHWHRIKISNRRATQRCNVSAFFYAKICSLLARRRSSQPVQRVYWPENVIDWLGKWRPTCVMRHARGQKLQSFRRKWPFYMDLYSMPLTRTRVAIFSDSTRVQYEKWLDSSHLGLDLLIFALNDSSQISYNLYRINSSKLLWLYCLGRTISPSCEQ
jgi:hypothetical protein